MIRVNIHLACIDEAVIAANRYVLGADEVSQAKRFHRPADRMLFEMGRIQRRRALAACLDIDAALLSFAAGEYGKPHLLNADTHHVHFSTSQCAGRAVIAIVIGTGLEIGVDIEPLDRPVSESLLHASLSAGERSSVGALPEAERGAAFMRLWTCKEAVMKACGLGLQLDPKEIDLDPERRTVISLPPRLGDPRDYPIANRVLPDGFSLAMCLHNAGSRSFEVALHKDP
jgi:4'-phosphopantetheinyl transferase